MAKVASLIRALALVIGLLPALGYGVTKYWIGPVGGSFSNNAHWTTTAGSACGTNANTTIPVLGDVATFVADCTNNAVITANINTAGITMSAGYTGTITQNNGVTVTLTNPSGFSLGNFIQADGTFVGGNSAILITGWYRQDGGSFTATSGTMTIYNSFLIYGGSFSHNSGTVLLSSGSGATLNIGSAALNNLSINKSGHTVVSGTNTVSGNFTMTDAASLQTGTIAVAGNVTTSWTDTAGPSNNAVILFNGAGDQTLTAATRSLSGVRIDKPSGTLTLSGTINIISGDWVHVRGNVDAGTSTVRFTSTSCDVNAPGMVFNNVTYNNSGYCWVSGSMYVGGNFNLVTTFGMAGGTIHVGGDLTTSDTSMPLNASTAITLNGTGNQTIRQTGGGIFPHGTFTINKASGTATLASDLTLTNASTNTQIVIAQGTLNLAGFNSTSNGSFTVGAAGKLQLYGSETITSSSKTFSSGSTVIYTGDGDTTADSYSLSRIAATYSNLTINSVDGTTDTFALSANVTVNDTLTLLSGNITTSENVMIISATASVSRTNGHVVGNLRKTVDAGSSITRFFEVGTGADYTPVTALFDSVTGFTGEVKVELLNAADTSIAVDANGCSSNWIVIQTITNPSFLIGENGRKTVSFQENNSWQNVRVRISHPSSGPAEMVACSQDNFAIRPSGLTVTASDNDSVTAGFGRSLTNAAATGGVVHRAGQPFTVTATATPATATRYAGTPTVKSTQCVKPDGCNTGPLTLGLFSGTGARTAIASYSEAGTLQLILEDKTFAAVDANDGTTLEELTIPQADSAVTIGRFIPDHFVLSKASTPQLRTFGSQCASRSFTYVGQPFDYVTTPQVTITAQNAANETTTNYKSDLWRLTEADVVRSYEANEAIETTMLASLEVASLGNGTGTVAIREAERLKFARGNPIRPFSAEISLTIDVSDASENSLAGNGLIPALAAVKFEKIEFDSGSSVRYGRLRLINSYGSELLRLPVTIETQFFNGEMFVANTADNCTTLSSTAIAMSDYQSNLDACETSVTIAGTGAVTAGKGLIWLSAPGQGNAGSVRLTAKLATAGSLTTCINGAPNPVISASLGYLQGNWTGGAHNVDPGALATFGVFRSSRRTVFMRERY